MSQMNRRGFLSGSMGLALPALWSAAKAEGWPVSQVVIVAPFPPGGSVDQMARLTQSGLSKHIGGATVIVENKPGAQGSIGANFVAKAKPDGGTWLFVFDTHAVNPSLQKLPFDTETDLEPVVLLGTSPHILCCHPSKPWKTFAEVLDAAKKDPGKINYGSIGTGSMGHLTTVLLAKRAGVVLTHVPFRGGGPLLNDAIGGHIDLAIASVAQFNEQIAAGTLRPLLQTGATRGRSLADTPTAIEAGFAGFESYPWWGVFAPKGTPKDLIDRMRAAIVASLQEPIPVKQMTETMQITPVFGDSEALRAWLKAQMKTWGDVARDNNITAGQ